MKSHLEALLVAAIVFAGALGFSGSYTARWLTSLASEPETAQASVIPVPDTPIDVVLARSISSETAHPGDVWRGVVIENVVREHDVVIPAGTRASGIVTAARSTRKGSRAMVELSVRSLELPQAAARIQGPLDVPVARADAMTGAASPAATSSMAVMGVVAGTPAARVMAVWDGVPVTLSKGAVMSFSVDHTVAVR